MESEFVPALVSTRSSCLSPYLFPFHNREILYQSLFFEVFTVVRFLCIGHAGIEYKSSHTRFSKFPIKVIHIYVHGAHSTMARITQFRRDSYFLLFHLRTSSPPSLSISSHHNSQYILTPACVHKRWMAMLGEESKTVFNFFYRSENSIFSFSRNFRINCLRFSLVILKIFGKYRFYASDDEWDGKVRSSAAKLPLELPSQL